jgi:hypothetical protein
VKIFLFLNYQKLLIFPNNKITFSKIKTKILKILLKKNLKLTKKNKKNSSSGQFKNTNKNPFSKKKLLFFYFFKTEIKNFVLFLNKNFPFFF